MASVDRIDVITLERARERYAAFAAQNAHLPIVPFYGVDGQAADRWDFVDEGLITAGNRYTMAAVGSAVSHIRLWQRCAASAVPIHIAEDDAIFRRDFCATASAALASLDDWDIVLWGWNFDWPLEAVLGESMGSAVLACDEATLRADWAAFPASTATPVMLRLVSNTGTCAYSLSPKGAEALLRLCLPVSNKPGVYPGNTKRAIANHTLDVEMTRHYASLQAFVSLPGLAVSLNVKAGESR